MSCSELVGPPLNSGIRRLSPDDAEPLVSLRRQALETEPLSFGASVDDDRSLSLERVRNTLADQDEQAMFGYFTDGDLVGMVGLFRLSVVKQRHKAQVWGMFVSPAVRTRGIGRQLLVAAIDHARAWRGIQQLHLSVTDVSVVARSMYESAGFQLWGREPRALAWEGRFVDEFHLVLELAGGAVLENQTVDATNSKKLF